MSSLTFTDKVRQIATNFANSMQPRNKRLLFLGSLMAKLEGKDLFDKHTVLKLNQVMGLSHNPNAVQFPALLSNVIWHGRTKIMSLKSQLNPSRLDGDSLKTVVDDVMSEMPSWLRYGSDEEIENDVGKLLQTSLAM